MRTAGKTSVRGASPVTRWLSELGEAACSSRRRRLAMTTPAHGVRRCRSWVSAGRRGGSPRGPCRCHGPVAANRARRPLDPSPRQGPSRSSGPILLLSMRYPLIMADASDDDLGELADDTIALLEQIESLRYAVLVQDGGRLPIARPAGTPYRLGQVEGGPAIAGRYHRLQPSGDTGVGLGPGQRLELLDRLVALGVHRRSLRS